MRISGRQEMMASARTQKPAVFMPVKEEVMTLLLKTCMFYIIHRVCVYIHVGILIQGEGRRVKGLST